MKDAFAAMAVFSGILLVVALVLWALSAWARHWRKIRSGREWNRWLLHQNRQNYPEITGSDLEHEAANSEHGSIRHRNESRHYDAA
jgi:hypothetical protein